MFKLPVTRWIILGLCVCAAPAGGASPQRQGDRDMGLTLTSRAFADNGEIPSRYTCDGEDTSPDLHWSGHRTGYGGPCPPVGRHRYFHKLYALDTRLPDLGHATKKDVERAMRGHILDQAELVGTYQR
jgi:phosphatidylethanolamine-binding protein (PEBP) family uncharacterized protein